jgi:Rrf2 family iron-sulfur cluster assembly transcriptional regulator
MDSVTMIGRSMLKLNKKSLLALEAVLDIAYNARPDPVQSKDVTARLGIPHRYLEQVMQELVHRGVLKGVRGPRGGYTLARERRRITVGEVVRIVDALERGDDDGVTGGSDLGDAVVRPLWREAEAAFLAKLDAVTMEDLCADAAKRGVARAGDAAPDFTI